MDDESLSIENNADDMDPDDRAVEETVGEPPIHSDRKQRDAFLDSIVTPDSEVMDILGNHDDDEDDDSDEQMTTEEDGA